MKEFVKAILKKSPIALSKNHLYDKQTQRIIKKYVSGDACTIDVGCHKGEILDLLYAAAPSGTHYGFEPIPDMYQGLVKKYSNQSNCIIKNVALSTEKGTSTFNHVVSNPSYSGLLKRDYDKPNEVDTSIDVETDLLDNIIPNDQHVTLIKIDVEGAEYLVLQGAKKTISRCKPIVVFEHGLGASDHYGTTPEQVYDYFDSCGLSIYNLGAFLKEGLPLSKEAFSAQYHGRKHYYFVAGRV